MFTVIQEQTSHGCFDSTISMEEAISFNMLPPSAQEDYVQDQFFSKGFGEGANNLYALSDAIKEHGMENVVSYTITI